MDGMTINHIEMAMDQYLWKYHFNGMNMDENPSYDLGSTRYQAFDPSPHL